METDMTEIKHTSRKLLIEDRLFSYTFSQLRQMSRLLYCYSSAHQNTLIQPITHNLYPVFTFF